MYEKLCQKLLQNGMRVIQYLSLAYLDKKILFLVAWIAVCYDHLDKGNIELCYCYIGVCFDTTLQTCREKKDPGPLEL